MQCDHCGGRIVLNRQDFVIREEPTNYRDTTLVTYAAHKTCHDAFEAAAQWQQHWSFTWSPQ